MNLYMQFLIQSQNENLWSLGYKENMSQQILDDQNHVEYRLWPQFSEAGHKWQKISKIPHVEIK